MSRATATATTATKPSAETLQNVSPESSRSGRRTRMATPTRSGRSTPSTHVATTSPTRRTHGRGQQDERPDGDRHEVAHLKDHDEADVEGHVPMGDADHGQPDRAGRGRADEDQANGIALWDVKDARQTEHDQWDDDGIESHDANEPAPVSRSRSDIRKAMRETAADARRPQRHGQGEHGDARGSVVFPRSLLQNQLVEREVGHRAAKPRVLRLQLLQPLHLVELEPAKFLAPAVVGRLPSRLSIARRRRPAGLATPSRRPASTWRRSLPACGASSAWWSSFCPKTYLQGGPLRWGWINRKLSLTWPILTSGIRELSTGQCRGSVWTLSPRRS